MDGEILTMDQTGEGLQLLPEGDYETRKFINANQLKVNEPILAEDDTGRENVRGNSDKASPRYDSGDNEVNTCEAISGVVISRQDDELIGHSTTVGSEKEVSNSIPIEECNQPSGDVWLPTFILPPVACSDCSKSSGICSEASVNMTASSVLVEERKQLDEDDNNTTSDELNVTSTEKIPDFERIPENWEDSSDNDKSTPISASMYDSKSDSDPFIAHAGSNESDTLRVDEISEDASIPDETLEDSEVSGLLIIAPASSNVSDTGTLRDDGISEDASIPDETLEDSEVSGLLIAPASSNESGKLKDDRISEDTSIPYEILEDSGRSDEDDALQRDEATEAELNRDADLPSEDDCEQSDKDEAAATELNRDADLPSEDDCEQSDEDEAAATELNRDADLPSEDDCEQSDNDEAEATELNRDADFPSEDCSEQFHKDDNAFKRDAIFTGMHKYTDLPNEILEVVLRKSDDGNALNSNKPKSTVLRVDVADCEQLDQGNYKTRDNSELSVQILSKNSDVSSEKPKHVCDISTSNEIKQLPTATTLKDIDVTNKNKDKNEPLSDGSKFVLCRNAMGGRKPSTISSIIDKYNTLLHSTGPPTEKDKFKPKSIKLSTSKDANCCTDGSKQETPRQNLVSNDVVGGGKFNCENLKGVQESSQREAIATADSRTNVTSDSDTQKHRDTNTSEVEKHEVRCDTKEKCENSPAIATNDMSQELDLTSEQDVDQAEKFYVVEVGLQENDHHPSRNELVEETCETNFIESPSESNSIRLGSTFGSLDADDEFSSPDDCKSATPKSPKSECENGNLYQKEVIRVYEIETLLKVNKGKMNEVLDDLPAEHDEKNKSYEEHTTDHKDVSTIPHNISVEPKTHATKETISLPVDTQLNDAQVLNKKSSQYVSQESKEVVEETVEAVSNEPLDMEDTELIYLDAESGDLNEQSVSSWDHIVSCLNSSANQSGSEMQECIQLYANQDMRSRESSIYDDVASGSNLEFSSTVNNLEALNMKYVSSYQSDNGSCSNFFSEEGDYKQSDNQDGYLSAFDLAEDLDVRSASGCCEPCELGSETYNSGEEGDDCHLEMSVNVEQEEHQTDRNMSLYQIVKQIVFPTEKEKESESPIEKTDVLCATMDQMGTMRIGLTGEANQITDSNTDECIKQEDHAKEECVSQVQTSSTSEREQAIAEECNSFINYEDIVETTTKNETLTNEGPDYFTKEGDCMKHEEGEIDEANLRDQAEEMDNIQDNSKKEEHPLIESASVEKFDNQAIEDESSSSRDKVDSKALSNLTTTFDNDNCCSEELKDVLVDISNNESILYDSTHETAEVKEKKSEASSDDEEDAEIKDACCKEYQVVLKRMKKLKKAMEKLTEQVSREKSYLQEETEKYLNRPKCNLTLFEHKLMEVQRERWLESQRVKISREEYSRRLQEADQMCVEEIQQMDAAEEKLRHLARITDVWTQTHVVLPYYDLPSLDMTEPGEEVTQTKVDELETQLVDLIGPSDVYMTSWLFNEAKKVKANYPVVGNKTSHIQNLNDLSVDQMLLPPHLLEKLEEMRDLVKANSLNSECTQSENGNCDQHNLQIKESKSRDALLTHQTKLTDAKRSAK